MNTLRVAGPRRTDAEAGFTLVELMVVVAIIAILAAIAMPRLTSYIRTAETAEAAETGGKIVQVVRAWVDAHPNVPVANLQSTLDNASYTDLEPGATNGLATLVPQLALPSSASWKYRISANVDTTTRETLMCIIAVPSTATDYSFPGTAGSELPYVLISSTSSTDPLWEGNLYRAGYVTPGTAAQASADCNADGSVNTGA